MHMEFIFQWITKEVFTNNNLNTTNVKNNLDAGKKKKAISLLYI